ncbi:aminoglycoside phosphotransferase family protein [Streptomyces montanisoli]|uniref:Aminoglycoside phosphotransferase family protein n=1 Tax=Streptomyces montanisoli TaxID=2798581 RepID=A0A940MH25_9ACTN|nr:aminoglycoside phosphotransferase family protein [Streptomyces montanisoli]MBP0460151.1 aminoglycoside phosphotransferase family protein [Streptomyces montanisoli]
MREVSEHPVDTWDALFRSIGTGAEPLTGYYHFNYAVALPTALAGAVALPAGSPVKLRVPIPRAPQFNLRIWPESELLAAVEGRVAGAPRVLARRAAFSVHSFADGDSMLAACGAGGPVTRASIERVGGLLRQTVAVPRSVLPPLPPGWPADGDCDGFLHALVDFAECEVKGRNGHAFRDLFAALGVPGDAFARVRARAGAMGRRPFVLVHTDVHRGNLIVGADGGLALIDWELALYGDPVYELATHLSRMRYTRRVERRAAYRAWRAAVEDGCPGALAGHRHALSVYLGLEAVQSLYTDVIRSMYLLTRSPDDPSVARAVASRIHAVLHAARGPAGLGRVPDAERVSAVCLEWLRGRSARAPRRGRADDGAWSAA